MTLICLKSLASFLKMLLDRYINIKLHEYYLNNTEDLRDFAEFAVKKFENHSSV